MSPVLDATAHLRRALGVLAKVVCLIRWSVKFCFALGAAGRHREPFCPRLPLGENDGRNLWDDISSFFYDDCIPHPEIKLLDVIAIMKGCPADGGAADKNRFKLSDWRDGSRASDLETDSFQPSFSFSGFELEGDSPARALGD